MNCGMPLVINRSRVRLGKTGQLAKMDTKGRNSTAFQKIVNLLPFITNGFSFSNVLGYGSHAVVLTATSQATGEKFAAKIVPIGNAYAEQQKKTVEAEIKALERLSNKSIIKYYESFDFRECKFIILELCTRGTLKDYISTNGVLEGEQLIKSMREMLIALNACHEAGVAHRDLKPGNIFIADDNHLVLADFGFAFVREGETEISDEYIGTLVYRAPELIRSTPYNPYKADIWALGVAFYVLARGELPWENYSSDAIRESILRGLGEALDGLPRDVKAVISAMMRMDATERPTAAEVLEMPLFTRAPHKHIPHCISLMQQHTIARSAFNFRKVPGVASSLTRKPQIVIPIVQRSPEKDLTT